MAWGEHGTPRVLWLPWDKVMSVNRRNGAKVGIVTREWRLTLSAARAEIARQVAAHRWPSIAGPVRVDLEYHPPDRRKRDLHNVDKMVMDSLEGPGVVPGVIEDDHQVRQWSGSVLPEPSEEPGVRITVTPICVDELYGSPSREVSDGGGDTPGEAA